MFMAVFGKGKLEMLSTIFLLFKQKQNYTCMHACMYDYIHTYIHTHIHTYLCVCVLCTLSLHQAHISYTWVLCTHMDQVRYLAYIAMNFNF